MKKKYGFKRERAIKYSIRKPMKNLCQTHDSGESVGTSVALT